MIFTPLSSPIGTALSKTKIELLREYEMKINFNVVFIFLLLSSKAVYSATGIACANGDSTTCSYTTIPSPGGVINGSPSVPAPRQIASEMAACVKEKGDIDKQFAKCNYNASLDNGRETALCSKFSDTSWSWGASVGHTVIFFNGSYTIESPSYSSCINQVAAAFTSAMAHCALKYVEHKNIARQALGGRCAGFFQ